MTDRQTETDKQQIQPETKKDNIGRRSQTSRRTENGELQVRQTGETD